MCVCVCDRLKLNSLFTENLVLKILLDSHGYNSLLLYGKKQPGHSAINNSFCINRQKNESSLLKNMGASKRRQSSNFWSNG